jgi:SPP1 family predicted phage head-tail adaptor
MSLIGQMRNRIVLQTLSTSSDGAGGQSASFGTATTVWAKVENLSGSESIFGDQLRGTNSYRFTIRYYSALTEKYRISYNSKTFNISYVQDLVEGREKFQVVLATEGVAT